MMQLSYGPAGRRKNMVAVAIVAMLGAALTPSSRAQAIVEGAQLSGQAKPPVAAPALGKTPAAAIGQPAAAPVVAAAPLHAASPNAGPMQASISTGAVVPGAFSAITHLPSENNVLHILVGHQVFIDTKSRLRRVIVADPSVLSSMTLTPNQIVVTAMGPGFSSLTLLDEIGRSQSYLISSDLDIDSLRATMQEALAGRHITVQGSGGRVVLSGVVATQADADAAVKLAGMYSKDVVNALVVSELHPKQVRLQVRILEVDRGKAVQYGINLFNPGGNTSFLAATTTTQYPSSATATQSSTGGGIQVTASNPLNFFLYSARANLGATIQDLQSKQVLQILAEPTITTISGQKADFLSGGEFPVPIAQPGGNGTAPVITVQFRPYGVKVEFTPVVNDDGTIRLTVAPEVSALDYTNAVSISGFTIPALSTRRAETQVELRSDQSFAISGLLDQRTSDLLDKNPGIASIPILGDLFKSKNSNHTTTELVVVVTPSIVDPLTDTEQPAQPDLPIRTLDRPDFDNSLGKNHNPRPAAPSLDPDRPPFGDAVPAPLPPDPNSPDAQIAGDPAPQQQSAPAAEQTAQTEPAPASPAATPQATSAKPQPQQSPKTAAPAQSSSPDKSIAIAPAPQTSPAPARILAVPASSPAAAGRQAQTPAAQPMIASAQPVIASAPTPQSTDDRASTATQPATAVATASGSTLVEIMALSHESDADATLGALRRHGYNPVINRNTQDSLLHLDLGPFPTRTQAEAVRARLQQDGFDATLK